MINTSLEVKREGCVCTCNMDEIHAQIQGRQMQDYLPPSFSLTLQILPQLSAHHTCIRHLENDLSL